ncbi:hypothetical protein E4U39_001209 [Claviceps sp. Clav50 group G5]|nr:hypothetical protein E4U39_001209 [Claviceps sp. Clav50 group G5]
MIFLHIVGHHVSYRNVSNRFRVSIGTINKIFNQVLVALAHNLYDEFVTQPGPEYVSEYVELNHYNNGARYHLTDFNGVDIGSLSMKELFNRHHAGMRSVVERVFGILKKVFLVLKEPAMELNWDQQRCIVYAVVALWNFARIQRVAKRQGGRASGTNERRLVLAAQKADRRIGDKLGREIRDLVAQAM